MSVLNKEEHLLKRIAKLIGAGIIGAFSLLGYVFTVRTSIEKFLGGYSLGLIEGGLILSTIFALIFYFYPTEKRTSKKEK